MEPQSAHYYTTSTAVGALIGTTFDGSSTPTYETVATFIAAASAEIEAMTQRIWTVGSATLELHDTQDRDARGVFFTRNTPILTVATFEINEGSPLDQSWTAKTEDTDFLVYPDRIEYGGTYLTYASLAHHPARFRVARISYTYGAESVPSDIAQAAAYRAASMALLAQRNSSAANGLTEFTVGQARYKFGDAASITGGFDAGFDRIMSARGRQGSVGFIAL